MWISMQRERPASPHPAAGAVLSGPTPWLFPLQLMPAGSSLATLVASLSNVWQGYPPATSFLPLRIQHMLCEGVLYARGCFGSWEHSGELLDTPSSWVSFRPTALPLLVTGLKNVGVIPGPTSRSSETPSLGLLLGSSFQPSVWWWPWALYLQPSPLLSFRLTYPPTSLAFLLAVC